MTTPKSLRLTLAALCLLALSLTATPASAAEPEKEPIVLLETLPGLSAADGVAFDKANGTVLVANNEGQEHPGEVQIFPSNGRPSVGVLNGAEGSQMTPQGRFHFETIGTTGVATDSAGDVYVSDTGNRVVDKFAPTGEPQKHEYQYLCQYSGPGRGCMKNPEVERGTPNTFGRTAGLAIDQAGGLYVADYDNGMVDEFDAAGLDRTDIATGDHPLIGSRPTGLAVNADGSGLFVQNETGGIVELSLGSFGVVTGETTVASGVGALVFDRESGLLLLQTAGRVAAYDPIKKEIVTGAGFQDASNPNFSPSKGGIAVQEPAGATGDVYLVETFAQDESREVINRYGIAPPLPPAVSGEAVAEVSSASAQLRATINPELRATHYVFQFGVDQSYDGGEVPLAPGGTIPGPAGSVLTTAQLGGLQPGATYHYRVVATNKAGTTYGPDETFTTFSAEEAGLADDRIYEMVSPLEKNGGAIENQLGYALHQAAAGGEGVGYQSEASFGATQGNPGKNIYIATRGSSGWVTQNVTPSTPSGAYFPFPQIYKAFSSDLSRLAFRNGEGFAPLPRAGEPLPGSNAPAGYDTIYVRDNADGAFRSVFTNPPPAGLTPSEISPEGFTPDLGHIVVSVHPNSRFNLETERLYEWSAATGTLTAVNVPEHAVVAGETVGDPVLGSGTFQRTEGGPNAISADGSRVFWSVGREPESVFVREDGNRTVSLPHGRFLEASTTGSKVLLGTGEVFDIDTMSKVADLTAGLGGFVADLGSSGDLSTIYFLDTAVLPGAGANSSQSNPQAGANNLYAYHEGSPTRFVATLAADAEPGTAFTSPDSNDWAGNIGSTNHLVLGERTTRVTPDGSALVFDSSARLTSYDNVGFQEVYVYHTGTGVLACVSCNPTGEPPIAGATIPAGNGVEQNSGGNRAFYQPRVLSSDGSRVFFDSPEALVAGDSNGVQDVYEYQDGRARLISSGAGTAATFFDASETGHDVFFTTKNQLVPGDTDQLADLYDARVDGGFPAPASEPACTGTGCQGVPAQPPIFATPSSGTFNGIGNFPAALAPPVVKPKAKTNAQKLAAALKKCHAKRGKKRSVCEVAARRRYARAAKSKSGPKSSNKRSK